jgi:hypothetical protein
MARPLSSFIARQPCWRMLAMWVATCGEIASVQVPGGGSAATTSSSCGSPRANHSATRSNSSCVYGGTPPRGIIASSLKKPSWVAPSAP